MNILYLAALSLNALCLLALNASGGGSTPIALANPTRVAFRLQRIRVVPGSTKTPFRGGWTSVAKTEEEHARTAGWLRARVTGR